MNTDSATLGLILRIFGGTLAFTFAKAWGFYPASSTGTEKKVFSHAYMYVIMIFVGEAISGLIGLKDKKSQKFKMSYLKYFIAPALLDGVAYTFSNLGIGGELISVQQVFRLTTIIFSTIINAFVNKGDLGANPAQKLLGLSIMFCGFTVIAIASFSLTPDEQPDCGTTVMSFVFVVVSGLASALHDLAASKYAQLDMNGAVVTSVEGIVGFVSYSTVGMIATVLAGQEHPIDWFVQHGTWYISVNQILFVGSVVMVCAGGYMCSKSASELQFQTVEAGRPLLVTFITIIAGFERAEAHFSYISISCQGLILIGYVLYYLKPKGYKSLASGIKLQEQQDQLVTARPQVQATIDMPRIAYDKEGSGELQ